MRIVSALLHSAGSHPLVLHQNGGPHRGGTNVEWDAEEKLIIIWGNKAIPPASPSGSSSSSPEAGAGLCVVAGAGRAGHCLVVASARSLTHVLVRSFACSAPPRAAARPRAMRQPASRAVQPAGRRAPRRFCSPGEQKRPKSLFAPAAAHHVYERDRPGFPGWPDPSKWLSARYGFDRPTRPGIPRGTRESEVCLHLSSRDRIRNRWSDYRSRMHTW